MNLRHSTSSRRPADALAAAAAAASAAAIVPRTGTNADVTPSVASTVDGHRHSTGSAARRSAGPVAGTPHGYGRTASGVEVFARTGARAGKLTV